MTSRSTPPDIVRATLAVLFIGILIIASFWILRPFLTALVWATMIVVTTWPFLLGLEKLLWGRRKLAVSVMTMVLLLLLVIPLTIGIVSVVERADAIVAWTRSLATLQIPLPPEWVGELPVVGQKIALQWQHTATAGKLELAAKIEPHLAKIVSWLVAQAGSGMMIIIQFLLTVIISAVLYGTGETAAAGVRCFARRLGGRHGEDAAVLAGKAIRGVALGVVVTALLQAILGAIGLALSGVPAVAVLSAVMFVLCVAQIGPAPVLFPATAWLFYTDQVLWGSVMVVWSLLVVTIDNFIRPVLIKTGADLPLLLIFAGVMGGLMAFGIIGLFIGPVLLAVTYTLLEAWVTRDDPAPLPPDLADKAGGASVD
jgi:predicted PurR-regulated permease PerM